MKNEISLLQKLFRFTAAAVLASAAVYLAVHLWLYAPRYLMMFHLHAQEYVEIRPSPLYRHTPAGYNIDTEEQKTATREAFNSIIATQAPQDINAHHLADAFAYAALPAQLAFALYELSGVDNIALRLIRIDPNFRPHQDIVQNTATPETGRIVKWPQGKTLRVIFSYRGGMDTADVKAWQKERLAELQAAAALIEPLTGLRFHFQPAGKIYHESRLAPFKNAEIVIYSGRSGRLDNIIPVPQRVTHSVRLGTAALYGMHSDRLDLGGFLLLNEDYTISNAACGNIRDFETAKICLMKAAGLLNIAGEDIKILRERYEREATEEDMPPLPQKLSAGEEALLNLLYHEDISPGMTADELAAAFEELLPEN
ncbi:MAG: hypothetical protein EA357_02990 [Micavibrio sp.]|nr:MAG: hypothetical protein EA357_02990 [Micavibrio sp.]